MTKSTDLTPAQPSGPRIPAESALSAIAYHLSDGDWGNARRVLNEYTADKAAHLSTDPGDGDPDMDEALRRVRAGVGVCPFCHRANAIGHVCVGLTPRGEAALGRLEVWAAHVLRDRQTTETDQRELAGAA